MPAASPAFRPRGGRVRPPAGEAASPPASPSAVRPGGPERFGPCGERRRCIRRARNDDVTWPLVGGRRGRPSPAASISVVGASTRALISSRMGRTASTPRPAGSSGRQSRQRLPGKTRQVSPQPTVTHTPDSLTASTVRISGIPAARARATTPAPSRPTARAAAHPHRSSSGSARPPPRRRWRLRRAVAAAFRDRPRHPRQGTGPVAAPLTRAGRTVREAQRASRSRIAAVTSSGASSAMKCPARVSRWSRSGAHARHTPPAS